MMRRFSRLRSFALLFFSSIILFSCNSNTQVADTSVSEPVLSMKNPVVKKEPKIFRDEVNYKLDSLNSTTDIDSLYNIYGEEQLETILAINRIERRRLRPQRPIVIPECASADFNTYSPFPEEVYFLKCIPKTVLISQRVQAFGLYENGELVKWGPVSTGKRSTRTPNGLNYGNYKAKRKISTVDESWIMPYYFNFMNFEGIGVHQYSMPGYPASHGCVRLYMDDAKHIFNWAEMWEVENAQITRNGTPFMVFGEYDYDSEKPWYDLSQNMKANDLTQDEIETLKKYVDQYQADPRNFGKVTSEEGALGEV
ncbi:L,D-transpeptidase [Christiangramia crocea]|uniref:L,D-transpeptidase n=1 Tax=Christiangramia crocea TaxID=2904124 RepID=A0A9X1UZJ8_9FLAO|nr:L,D-transpeptidase [Gramella crocea]MCG9973342.1 L,D-transpeptidase [Gramella crocea]